MLRDADSLRDQLRHAGLSKAAVDAAWPDWWSEQAESSPSAQAELRFSIARNLGLSPRSLIGERVDFVWHDRARFKHLGTGEESALAALNSFGVSVGRSLIDATQGDSSLRGISADRLRSLLLRDGPPDLFGLVALCWAVGTPVAHLRVWPLAQKAMHALVVGHRGRNAILFCREASYPAVAAFTLAHEIGHIALGHVPENDLLVEVEDPTGNAGDDEEESSADQYALELLMGDPNPDIRINFDKFNSAELADAVLRASPQYGIDPGTLALAVAHRQNAWPVAMAAMRLIYSNQSKIPSEINAIALGQLRLDRLGWDSSVFLQRVLGVLDAG